MEEILLTIVIPAYNEEEALSFFMPELVKASKEKNWKVIVVNDGSKDKTLDVLDSHTDNDLIRVINHKLNRGYGGALKTGIKNANTKYVITIDADGQHRIEDISRMLEFMIRKDADMVVGRRQNDATNFRAVGKSMIRFFARLMMPLPVFDLNSGMKIYQTALVQKVLHLCPDTMAFSDIITLVMINNRHLVLENPITVNQRTTGESTINIKTAINTVYEILNIVLLFNPMKFFLPVGLILIFIGILWEIPVAIFNKTISVGASLSISVGLIVIVFGLLAEQIAQIRKNQSM